VGIRSYPRTTFPVQATTIFSIVSILRVSAGSGRGLRTQWQDDVFLLCASWLKVNRVRRLQLLRRIQAHVSELIVNAYVLLAVQRRSVVSIVPCPSFPSALMNCSGGMHRVCFPLAEHASVRVCMCIFFVWLCV
jgi:hypothetical protein